MQKRPANVAKETYLQYVCETAEVRGKGNLHAWKRGLLMRQKTPTYMAKETCMQFAPQTCIYTYFAHTYGCTYIHA